MYLPTQSTGSAPAALDPWIGLEEIAADTGVAISTVKKWTRPRTGYPLLRCSKPAHGVWRFRRSWVDAFLEDCSAQDRGAGTLAPPTSHRPPAAVIDPLREIADRPPRAPRRRRRGTVGDANLPIIAPLG
ncbi:hypothetical protein PAI11_37830 [Patulibacter medicamentivorans]|uniref:Helix-turn-helix domain-containing protein n=1 Tax=Patulibacter medicamentivorans TaxID=1097667 RepID=H0EAA9_9ACTN|nr:hypothetical protein [Patulibacter medicamentivorans]EHN09449.1 hypothetical protein PAI11_37830 [Patulibacter medicamentivorans]